MNRRLVITSIAVVAAALAAAAYFLLRDGDATPRAASNEPGAQVEDGPSIDRAIPDRIAPRARPAPGTSGGGEEPDVYYLEDGTRVRDHRSGDDKEPPIWPGDLPHPSRSPVTPQVTSKVMALVRPVVLRCFQALPDAAFADDAIVVTRAVVSIDEAGKLTVLELGPQSRGVDASDPAAAEAAHQCVRDGAAGLTTQVENAAVESTVLAFPVRPQQYRR